jgi:hypothetical protein
VIILEAMIPNTMERLVRYPPPVIVDRAAWDSRGIFERYAVELAFMIGLAGIAATFISGYLFK